MHSPVFRHPNRVTFADTDASGRAHFTRILRFVEEAEHAFFRAQKISVFAGPTNGWPRVNVTCDFLRPLQFEDEVETRLNILKLGNSSVTWGFEIFRFGDGIPAARGSMVTVWVDVAGQPLPLPDELREMLSVNR